MKLLVLGGTHGNERLGIDLVRSLQKDPIAGVECLIANPKAVARQKRYVETDLNRSFGQQKQSTYESRRANQLSKVLSSYDVVLDFHNTETPNNNCCFVGQDCSLLLYTVAKRLGFLQCIEATYDCVNKYCLNTISIEVSIDDSLDSVEYWRDVITQLLVSKRSKEGRPLSIYRFLRRVTWSEQKTLELSPWNPFKQITESDKAVLEVKGLVAPIFIGSRLTEYYATLINKIGEK